MQTQDQKTEEGLLSKCPRLSGVKEFALSFNHPYTNIPVPVVDIDYIKKRIGFIQEELRELEEAAEKNDIAGCVDALVDIDYFNLGTVLGLGVENEFIAAFDIVQKANMSKLCKSLEEVQATIEKYESEGIPCTYAEVLQGRWAVYNSETNKVLKSINFVAPDLTVLFPLKYK